MCPCRQDSLIRHQHFQCIAFAKIILYNFWWLTQFWMSPKWFSFCLQAWHYSWPFQFYLKAWVHPACRGLWICKMQTCDIMMTRQESHVSSTWLNIMRIPDRGHCFTGSTENWSQEQLHQAKRQWNFNTYIYTYIHWRFGRTVHMFRVVHGNMIIQFSDPHYWKMIFKRCPSSFPGAAIASHFLLYGPSAHIKNLKSLMWFAESDTRNFHLRVYACLTCLT